MKLIRWVSVLGLIAAMSGCRPPAPTPSQYEDLGTTEAPLPPTGPAWHDPSVAKGTSEWKPFRKLEAGGEKSASAKSGGNKAEPDVEDKSAEGGEGPEGEIRTLVGDFNAALAEKKFDEASEFLSDAQAAVANDVFTAVNELVEQLGLLAKAAPGMAPKVDALAPVLNLSDSLQMKVATVTVDGKTATAKLESGAEAKFMVGEEDLWYLESPLMAVLDTEKARIQKATDDIKAALAGGTPDEAATTSLGASLDELLAALTAPPKPAEEKT